MNLDSDRVAAEPGQLEHLAIDLPAGTVTVREVGDVWQSEQTFDLDDPRAFEAISIAWLRCAWDVKHQWSYSWFGRPIIQLPEDMFRVQELVWRLRPDVILETGVAHGGSLVFYASLCKALGHGRVIGVELPRSPDLDHRDAIMQHPLADYITLIHGDSIAADVVDRVYDDIGVPRIGAQPHAPPTVLLLLDSDHSRSHVISELVAYGPLVTPGSYAIVQDGFIQSLVARTHGPRANPDWATNNALVGARAFVAANADDWAIGPPDPPFDEGVAPHSATHFTGGWLRRLR